MAIKALVFPKEYLLNNLGMLYPHQEQGFQSIDEDNDMADLMGVAERLNEIINQFRYWHKNQCSINVFSFYFNDMFKRDKDIGCFYSWNCFPKL